MVISLLDPSMHKQLLACRTNNRSYVSGSPSLPPPPLLPWTAHLEQTRPLAMREGDQSRKGQKGPMALYMLLPCQALEEFLQIRL